MKRARIARRAGAKRRVYKKGKYAMRKKLPLYRAPMGLTGFPQTKMSKLSYVKAGQMTVSSGATASQIFSANSLYDPDVTGAGHQPYGFDQWSAFYNHYVVTGAKITYTIIPSATNAAVSSGIIHLLLTDDGTTAADSQTLMEQGKSRYRLMGVSSNVKSTTIKQYYSARKFFNIKDVKDNLTRIGATVTASPSEQAYFITKVASLTGAVQTIVYDYIAKIDFFVQWSEPKELTAS